MAFVILKELLPSLEGTEGYDESMNYIGWCSCIENDERFSYNSYDEANNKLNLLANDERYFGRKLKIREIIE